MVGIEMANNPPDTPSKKWIFRITVIIFGVALLILTWIQYKSDAGKDADEKSARQAYTNTEQGLKDEVAQLKVKLDNAQTGNDQVLLDVANGYNPILAAISHLANPPEVSSSNGFDLGSSISDLKNWQIQTQAEDTKDKLNTMQNMKDRASQCSEAFDYMVNTLYSIVSGLAEKNGDYVSSNYRGTPPLMMPNTNLDSYATIKLQLNYEWKFDISFAQSPRFMFMIIKGGNSSVVTFRYIESNETILSRLEITGMDQKQEYFPIKDYQAHEFKILNLMIAAQYEASPLKDGGVKRAASPQLMELTGSSQH